MPTLVALVWFSKDSTRAAIIMIATLLVDLDHLLANPIYDPSRCSIGFHPLHTLPLILVYFGLGMWSKTRLVGIGLLIHMALDAIDCRTLDGLLPNLQ